MDSDSPIGNMISVGFAPSSYSKLDIKLIVNGKTISYHFTPNDLVLFYFFQ